MAETNEITNPTEEVLVTDDVKPEESLSKTIQSILPRLATKEFVRRIIDEAISGSEETAAAFRKVQEALTNTADMQALLKAMEGYVKKDGDTIEGDLRVTGIIDGQVVYSQQAFNADNATHAARADRADSAQLADEARICTGNAATATSAVTAARALEAKHAEAADKAKSAEKADTVETVDWNKVLNRPTAMPADGGTADVARFAEGVEWEDVKHPPRFLTEVDWTIVKNIPPYFKSDSVDWSRLVNKPAGYPAAGGKAETCDWINWDNIKGKPAKINSIGWDDIIDKPTEFPVGKVSWDKIMDKPEFYPVESITWGQITGKPASFPVSTVPWGNIVNKPESFPSKWDDIAGKPGNFVYATDVVDKAKQAEEAQVALNIPNRDMGGNIWIST